ncbi:MAG: CocE/NonD family hydrolase [Acidobacteria bacterium]|nr:CocE/NonD family hydrolase [Acidobacteriota bacterium]
MRFSNWIRQILLGGVLVVVSTCSSTGWAQSQSQQPTEPPQVAALPVPLSGFSDEGAFHVYLNEDRLATISFKWQPDGTFDNTATLSMAGQTVTTIMKIVPDKNGQWVNISMETPQGPVTVVREGDVARRTIKDKVTTVNLKPGAVLFENFSPALYTLPVRVYDKAKGGKQTFPLFIVPGVMLEGSLEMKDKVERAIGGQDVEFTRYVYSLPGVDVTMWVGADGKLYLADVPAQHAVIVREGYEILRQAPESDPLLSSVKYQVKEERGVGVPMRDGIKLATDIYRPDAEGQFPVILVRTPYKKEMVELQARYYARRGYVFAVQDCRGRFSSPGTWEPFVNEKKDGYDTIEWLAVQPWSTGKVGMIGASYLGWVQWWAASQRPPHLVTIIPNVSPPDPFYNVPYEYGAFFLMGAIWWADVVESEATADLSGAALSKIGEKKYTKLLRSLPVIDLDKSVLGKENPYWRKWIEHPTNDAYWEQTNFLDYLKDVRLPVFHQSGWFDGDGIGTKLNYLRMVSHGHPNQKLVLGPWAHTPEAHRSIGDHDFGPEAIVDLQRAYLRWFDYWLKGIDNGIAKEPLVSLFVMGSNKWLHGNVYPLPQTCFEKWYLSSNGQANTSKGDGRLTLDLPPADALADRYTYDPGDATPAPSFYEEPEEEAPKVKSSEERKKEAEAYHENVTQTRRDILVYVSDPFSQPYTFAGPVSAVLYASSSARDTDWFVRLMEVDKEGKIFSLAEGKIRARFRRSMKTPALIKLGRVYEYILDLWHTGITIPAGHRLRVEVASASFPVFSRNLNTGGHNEKETRYVTAEQIIYHNRKYPSHLLLPAISDMKTLEP